MIGILDPGISKPGQDNAVITDLGVDQHRHLGPLAAHPRQAPAGGLKVIPDPANLNNGIGLTQGNKRAGEHGDHRVCSFSRARAMAA